MADVLAYAAAAIAALWGVAHVVPTAAVLVVRFRICPFLLTTSAVLLVVAIPLTGR